ncbi:MAG: hypothetical protein M3176_19405, partial [Chloroflexota bacterium]|nr:hypothetical protein [Chloroflexota bacterium]
MTRTVLAACLAMLLFAPGPAQAQGIRTFRAGAYAQNITPKKYPVSVNGGMNDQKATRASDPLHARCLV